MGDQEGRFLLAGEEDSFRERAGTLFDALSGVQYSPTQDVDGFLKSDPLKDRGQPATSVRNMEQRRNASRRRPEGGRSTLMPPPRRLACKRKQANLGPMRNSSKYIKYSLDDVPDQQLTQKSNTAAALAFLREIDEKKRKDEADEDMSEGQKPVFKKPINRDNDKSKKDLSSSTKTTGPEQTSGLKVTSKHRVPKGKEIKLSHLEYEDE